MSVQPPADDVRPYLELGLACAGEGDSEALVRLLASRGYWDFGYGIDPADESGARGFAAAQRAREITQRLERPDLELMTLDSLTSGLNIRGLYGHSEPIDNERRRTAPYEALPPVPIKRMILYGPKTVSLARLCIIQMFFGIFRKRLN